MMWLICIFCCCFFFSQIHHIDFDDENNVINKNVFLHKEGEIWHISASTLDRNLLTTCYNKSKLSIRMCFYTMMGKSGTSALLLLTETFSQLATIKVSYQ